MSNSRACNGSCDLKRRHYIMLLALYSFSGVDMIYDVDNPCRTYFDTLCPMLYQIFGTVFWYSYCYPYVMP